ncbi:hypothetical protein J0X19_22475 [Hymenobacter sp. BT186]|uniref:Uncharacterized protein n=1 Tax=Hymenobacter telluris TaxID=2816474 RepID=A0A939JBB3_9BACT|nr:hypothetical protein [Hymenobacter telluris]MBO0360744.1 hypothetical protein [Hymenobacter telluris]MBW3376772.1 hypothetical protein [Hymenobacter norwichensis]
MMLRHSQYVGLLRELATRHKQIQHTPAAPRFARILVSQDPFQRQVDMHELTTIIGRTLKAGPGQQVLVVESCVTDYQDNLGDNRTRLRHAAYMVLTQVPSATDHNAVEAALDATEQTGEELFGALEHQLATQVKVRVLAGSLGAESIGPLANSTWFGTRFDFDFTTPASGALRYHPDAFLP